MTIIGNPQEIIGRYIVQNLSTNQTWQIDGEITLIFVPDAWKHGQTWVQDSSMSVVFNGDKSWLSRNQVGMRFTGVTQQGVILNGNIVKLDVNSCEITLNDARIIFDFHV